MVCSPMPICARCKWPNLRNCRQARPTTPLGMAKPSPSFPPDCERMKVLTPTTWPSTLTSGPPEFVDQRASGVSRVDGGVCLDVHQRRVGIGLPRDGGNHAHGDRISQSLRAPKGKDHLALSQLA